MQIKRRNEVSASVADDTTDFLKQLKDLIMRGLNNLVDLGLKVREDTDREKEAEKAAESAAKKTGSDVAVKTKFYIVETVDPENDNSPVEVKLAATPIGDSKDRFDVVLTLPSGKEYRKENIRQADLSKFVVSSLDDANLGTFENEDDIQLSTRIRCTLQKVTSGTETSIELVAINANIDPAVALDVITELAESGEFADMIKEEPTSFSIVDEGEEYDIAPCDEVSTDFTYECMTREAIRTYFNLKTIHWNARGEGFFELHGLMDHYIWMLQSQIDTLAELAVEFTGRIQNPLEMFINSTESISGDTGFTLESGYSAARDQITSLISTYESLYCNCPADVQSTLDEWIRTWKSEANYKLTRTIS